MYESRYSLHICPHILVHVKLPPYVPWQTCTCLSSYCMNEEMSADETKIRPLGHSSFSAARQFFNSCTWAWQQFITMIQMWEDRYIIRGSMIISFRKHRCLLGWWAMSILTHQKLYSWRKIGEYTVFHERKEHIHNSVYKKCLAVCHIHLQTHGPHLGTKNIM